MSLFNVWREDKLNKKFKVAENFAKLVSKGKRFCLFNNYPAKSRGISSDTMASSA